MSKNAFSSSSSSSLPFLHTCACELIPGLAWTCLLLSHGFSPQVLVLSNRSTPLHIFPPPFLYLGWLLPFNRCDFNPNMKQLATGADDNTLMVWNFKAQMRAFRFVGHTGTSSYRFCRQWCPQRQSPSPPLPPSLRPLPVFSFLDSSSSFKWKSEPSTCYLCVLMLVTNL